MELFHRCLDDIGGVDLPGSGACITLSHKGCTEFTIEGNYGEIPLINRTWTSEEWSSGSIKQCVPIQGDESLLCNEICIDSSGFDLQDESLTTCTSISVTCGREPFQFTRRLELFCGEVPNCHAKCGDMFPTCSNHGTCDVESGMCTCRNGTEGTEYYGVDCSVISTHNENGDCISAPFTDGKEVCAKFDSVSCERIETGITVDDIKVFHQVYDLSTLQLDSQKTGTCLSNFTMFLVCDGCIEVRDVSVKDSTVHFCPTLNVSCGGVNFGNYELDCIDRNLVEDCNSLVCPNQCSGNGDCVEARCICNSGFYGDDCSTMISNGCITTPTLDSSQVCLKHKGIKSDCESVSFTITEDGSEVSSFSPKTTSLTAHPLLAEIHDGTCQVTIKFGSTSVQDHVLNTCPHIQITCDDNYPVGFFPMDCIKESLCGASVDGDDSNGSKGKGFTTYIILGFLALVIVSFVGLAVWWWRSKRVSSRVVEPGWERLDQQDVSLEEEEIDLDKQLSPEDEL